MGKKAWEKPQLIVLVRSTSGESVLRQCKAVQGVPTATPIGVMGQNCKNRRMGTCGACQAEGGQLS